MEQGSSQLADLPAWLGLLIVLSGLLWSLVFASASGPQLVFDDIIAVTDNPQIEQVWPLSEAMGAPLGSGASGRPLVAWSLSWNYALGGRDSKTFLRFNLLVHALSALALFGLVRRLLLYARKAGRSVPPPTLAAALLAHLWLVHPLHTMVLDNVIYRNEAMCGLFYLTSLYCALRGFHSDRRTHFFALAIVASLAAGACKEVAVSLPFAVLILQRISCETGTLRAAVLRHKGLYIGLCSTWPLLALLVLGGDRGESVGFDLEGLSSFEYLCTQATVLPYYLRLAVWPNPLVLDYDGWAIARGLGAVWLPGLCVLAALGAALFGFMRKSTAASLGLWAFLVLAPTSSLIPLGGALVGEHRTYLPLVVFIALLGSLLMRGLQRLGSDAQRTRLWMIALCLPLALAWGAKTRLRHQDYWRPGASIWHDTVVKRPDNPRALISWGAELAKAGDSAGARSAYDRALGLRPTYYKALINLGNLNLNAGDIESAGRLYDRALDARPDIADVQYYVGSTRIARGDHLAGVRHLREALRLGLPPKLAMPARQQLAWTLATSRDGDVRNGREALEVAQQALAQGSTPSPRVLDALAAALAATGDFERAVRVLNTAIAQCQAPGQAQLQQLLKNHLAAYTQSRPWRE